jgi:hypothetical protein
MPEIAECSTDMGIAQSNAPAAAAAQIARLVEYRLMCLLSDCKI